MFPDQFPNWFGLPLANGGRASTFLFPQILADATPALTEGARVLSDADFMSGKTEDRYPDLFNLAAGVDGGGHPEARTDVAEHVAQLPHHSVILGHDVNSNAEFLAKTLTGN